MTLFFLLGILSTISFSQECRFWGPKTLRHNDSLVIELGVFGAARNDLADSLQGVCEVRLSFLHNAILDFEVSLVSPAGQEVRLIGPNGSISSLTLGGQWNIGFVPCATSAQPDPPFQTKWDNQVNFFPSSRYKGTYYPFSGCLEDFDRGPVNGTWKLKLKTFPTAVQINNRLDNFEIRFCDELGRNCCFADAGQISGPTVLKGYQGDSSLLLSPKAQGQQTDSLEYGYTWLLGKDHILLERGQQFDLRAMPAGEYEVCGLSYDWLSTPSLPNPDSSINLDSLRIALKGFNPPFCGQIMDTCISVVIDNKDTCSISGIITSNFGQAIEGVELYLSRPDEVFFQLTGSDGNFKFSNLSPEMRYLLEPKLDKEHNNGVSTRDAIALQFHLTGKRALSDPHLLIAADANNSGLVTIADAIAIRKVILGIEQTFPSNKSWRFVEKQYSFPDQMIPSNPPFPEIKQYHSLSGNQIANFTGIKIGDLTGDARANSKQGTPLRSGRSSAVGFANHLVAKGDRLRLLFHLKEPASLDGMQFTLAYDRQALKLILPDCSFPEPEKVGIFEESPFLTFLFDKPLKNEQILAELSFEALQNGQLSKWIEINSRITNAEGYSGQQTLPVILLPEEQTFISPKPKVLQNYPNPFQDITTLPFWLPKQDRIWLKIFDLTGKLVYDREELFGEGMQAYQISNTQLGQGNHWYYQLGGSDWEEVRKMVRIRK